MRPSRWILVVVGAALLLVGCGIKVSGSATTTRRTLIQTSAQCQSKVTLVVRSRWQLGRGIGPVVVEGDSAWVSMPTTGVVVRLAGAARTTLHLGGTPISLALQPGRLWVALRDADKVVSIDTSTLRQLTTSVISVPVSVITGPLGVWALSLDTAALYQIDAQNGIISVPADSPTANPTEMVLSGEELWVLGAGEQGLAPFNTKLGRIVRAGFDLPDQSMSGLSASSQAIWTGEPRSHAVIRVDARSGAVHQFPAPADMRPTATAISECGLWVAGPAGDVDLLNPQSGAPLAAPLHVGSAVAAVASSGSEAWVTDPLDGDLLRIEARQVSTLPSVKGSKKSRGQDLLSNDRATGKSQPHALLQRH